MPKFTIRTLHPDDEEILEAFLLPRLETSMFLIGNMRASGLAYDGKRFTGTYVAAFEDDAIVAAAAHFWNGVLIVQAPTHLDAVWHAALEASGRPLEGVLGTHAQVDAVRTALSIAPSQCQMDSKEKLYSLSLDAIIVPEALRTGQVTGRRVTASDRDILAGWRVGYEVETLGEEETEQLWAEKRADVTRVIEAGDTWVVEAQGQSVATSAFNTRIKEAVQIGGVWTPPKLRSRGYARCVVAQSLLDARAEGADKAILFTGEDNIPAQKAYEALGFRYIGDYHILLLAEPLDVAS